MTNDQKNKITEALVVMDVLFKGKSTKEQRQAFSGLEDAVRRLQTERQQLGHVLHRVRRSSQGSWSAVASPSLR